MTTPTRLIVWIVDDAEPVRKSIAAVLETADITVRDYGSAGEFLAAFTPMAPSCLVVDHHMPDMTGIELLQHLQERGVKVPTVVITGKGDAQLKERALMAGAVTLLHKPVDGEELIAVIARLMPNQT